ncbi:MAG: ribosomal protein S18-alanine N-acetyltransferase [Idiomarina sp.]|nr:ribosomal protein S18-alanine N-acetyltransferase [Idiomarina sp.]
MIFAPLHRCTDALLSIEQASHEIPWTRQLLEGCFGPGYRVVGAYENQELIGFYVLHEVAGEATLMNIAVAPQHRGKGLGSALLNDLLYRLSHYHHGKLQLAAPVFLEVRESNESAIRLYERFGFKQLGVRPNYYPTQVDGMKEAALVYMKSFEG